MMEFWVDTSAAFSPGCKVYCQLPELDSVSPVSVRIPSSYFGPDEAENWYIKKEVPVEISYFEIFSKQIKYLNTSFYHIIAL